MGSGVKRGVLIVLEGCDRAGKSTQCKKLIDALNEKGIPSKHLHFPVRTTATGQLIDSYLKMSADLHDKAIHLLFSANRWESEPEMKKLLQEGTSIVIDRYAFSGAAYSAAKPNMDLSWCCSSDIGLPKPDQVFFLDIDPKIIAQRVGFGEERYEKVDYQSKVYNNFLKLKDESWKVIKADADVEVIHQEILRHSLDAVQKFSSSALELLWQKEKTKSASA